MTQRAAREVPWVIVIFLPPSDVDERIRRYRERYDPLAAHIAPHLTLVHPFVDDIPPSITSLASPSPRHRSG